MSQDVRGTHQTVVRAIAVAAIVMGIGLVAREARAETATCEAHYENAQVLSASGKLVAARAAYLKCGQSACPDPLRSDCTKQYDALLRRVPSIILSARSADGADLPRAQIELDGQRVAQTVGRAVELDPGPHRVAVTHGGVTESFEIVAREGESFRSIVHTMRASEQRTGAPSSEPSTSPNTGLSPAIYGVGALGALGFASFALFGIRSMQDSSALHDQCSPRCSEDAESKLRTQLIVADVSLAIGVVATAAFVWLFVDARRAPVQAAVRF